MTFHFASPSGGPTLFDGQTIQTRSLQDALDRLRPGDTLQLVPGTYSSAAILRDGGRAGAPITIRGLPDGSVVFDSARAPEQGILGRANLRESDYSFLKLFSADHVDLEHIHFRNNWPNSVYIGGSRHVTLRDCAFTGGRWAVFAANRLLRRASDIRLERVRWLQDVEHKMWTGAVSWQDVKNRDGATQDASYFRGALFSALDIVGRVTIEDCSVAHAFNALIFKDDGNRDLTPNIDIRVIGCDFSYVRDNAIEPERRAERLWVLDNSFLQIHAPFSFDGVAGRHWYYLGNRVLNLIKPGQPGQSNRGGKVFKFWNEPPYPKQGFHFAFNSILTRSNYVGGGETRAWLHQNNAIGILREGPDTEPDTKLFRRSSVEEFKWHKSLTFGPDLCDHPNYPDQVDPSYEITGLKVPAGTSTFAAPELDASAQDTPAFWDRQLSLASGSPGRGASAAICITLPDGRVETIPAGRDMGAPMPEVVRTWMDIAPLVG